ncbi:hypothetical protein [Pelosinus propionicus]|uniref:Uncharacterized protein n=1 Tax=Pelosinus propionicus DSM 13327 TaxID=1123291 RepID=A0A1I4N2N5_9FIRM|nr:hypothetical protein [Pelosinus propionicus]SFM09513.1 hypothetical protein SAMN04490355_104045 [Pelosinus propionicus DSM 13327]
MELVRGYDEEIFEGNAIKKDNEYEFPCPICGEEVIVDDFGPAYRCGTCKKPIRFREENIKTGYYLCDCCRDTDNPIDEDIYNCKKCGGQICNACVINLQVGEEIPCDGQHDINPKYCPFCGIVSYTTYTEVTKELLDTIKVGDLIKVNDWKKPMKVRGVSPNYAVMTENNFGKTYYSVIEKKPWDGDRRNAMRGGRYHCGRDNWIFGAPHFEYKFDDEKAVAAYLQTFERGETELSVRNAIPILELHIKHVKGESKCKKLG